MSNYLPQHEIETAQGSAAAAAPTRTKSEEETWRRRGELSWDTSIWSSHRFSTSRNYTWDTAQWDLTKGSAVPWRVSNYPNLLPFTLLLSFSRSSLNDCWLESLAVRLRPALSFPARLCWRSLEMNRSNECRLHRWGTRRTWTLFFFCSTEISPTMDSVKAVGSFIITRVHQRLNIQNSLEDSKRANWWNERPSNYFVKWWGWFVHQPVSSGLKLPSAIGNSIWTASTGLRQDTMESTTNNITPTYGKSTTLSLSVSRTLFFFLGNQVRAECQQISYPFQITHRFIRHASISTIQRLRRDSCGNLSAGTNIGTTTNNAQYAQAYFSVQFAWRSTR